jgi:16S rRNA (cytidine1402-2'-O)-methyltransferase
VEDVEGALREAMKTMSVKDASTMVAESFGLARRDVYQMALKSAAP